MIENEAMGGTGAMVFRQICVFCSGALDQSRDLG